ncbi:MAG TPA: hypothetical protein VFD81_02300 [Methylomirabilota bacterium]|nr:hypothetical protein [Methylomirabilota bacterium]
MIARERTAMFLMANRGRELCDRCLARALGIDPSTGYRAAEKVARTDAFIRRYGDCSDCGASRLVTRAA